MKDALTRRRDNGRPQGKGVSGFTLVELLVVIGIISVLLSLLMTTLGKARAAAMEAICMSNLKQMGVGFQTYADSNHGWLPAEGPDGTDIGSDLIAPQTQKFAPNGTPTSPPPVMGINDPSIWYNAIPPLTQGKSYYQMILADPTAMSPTIKPRPATWGNEPLATHDRNSIFVCPMGNAPGTLKPWTGGTQDGDEISSDGDYFIIHGINTADVPTSNKGTQGAYKCYMSYVLNSMLFGQTNDGAYHLVWKMSQLRPASSVILLVEKLAQPAEDQVSSVQQYLALPQGYQITTYVTSAGYTNEISQMKANWKRFTTRHRQGGMLLFADGHVAWYSWSDVQPPFNAGNPNAIDGNQPDKGLVWNPLGGVGTKNTDN